MKKLLSICTLLVLSACSYYGPQGKQGIPGNPGADGKNTHNFVFSSSSVLCASGSGKDVYLDVDDSASLSSADIYQTTICDGSVGATGVGSAGDTGATGATGAASTVPGPQGPAGTNGTNGTSPHLWVFASSIPDVLVCSNGGSSTDVYSDLDDSLNYSAGDQFLFSLVTCKGDKGDKGDTGAMGATGSTGSTGATGANGNDSTVPGPQGPAGSNGTATIVAYTPASTCTLIYTGVYAQNHADNITLHNLSTCSGPSKFYTLSGSVAPIWIADGVLATYQPISNSHNQVRVVNYN